MEFLGLDKKFYKWIKLDEVDVDLDDFFRFYRRWGLGIDFRCLLGEVGKILYCRVYKLGWDIWDMDW